MSASLIKLAEQPHLQSSVGGRHCGHCEGMLDSHALAISAAAPGTAFLAVRMGLFRSDDRGATWHDTEIGRYSRRSRTAATSSSRRTTRESCIACLSQAAFSTAGSLYRSDDVAQTWRRIDHGVTAESTVMAVSRASGRSGARLLRHARRTGHRHRGPGALDRLSAAAGVHDVYAVACV